MEKDKNKSLIKEELLILKNDLSNIDPNFTSLEIDSYNIKIDKILKEVDYLEKRGTGARYIMILSIVLAALSAFLMFETTKTQDEIQNRIDDVTKISNTADSILNSAKESSLKIDKTSEELTQVYKKKNLQNDSILEANSKLEQSLEIAKRKLNLAESKYGIKFKEERKKDVTTISIYSEQELFRKVKKNDSLK